MKLKTVSPYCAALIGRIKPGSCFRYWIPGEPNDYGQREDCAALMIMRDPRAAWFDADCKGDKEWLCEMEPN